MKIKNLVHELEIEGNLVFIFPKYVVPSEEDVVRYYYNGSRSEAEAYRHFRNQCNASRYDRYVLQKCGGGYAIVPINYKHWEFVDYNPLMSKVSLESSSFEKRPKEDSHEQELNTVSSESIMKFAEKTLELKRDLEKSEIEEVVKSYLKEHLKIELKRGYRGRDIWVEVYIKLDNETINWSGVTF